MMTHPRPFFLGLLFAGIFLFLWNPSPSNAFTVYRIDPHADWLVNIGGTEQMEDEDFWGDNHEDLDEDVVTEEEMAAFDEDALEESEVVVEDDETRPAWRGVPTNGIELAKEELLQSYTSFIVELDEPAEELSDKLVPEQFGPPTTYIIGTNGEMENDVMKVVAFGDAVFGSLEEEDPAGKYYLLRMEYFCKKPGSVQVGVRMTYFTMEEEIANVTFIWNKECASDVRKGFVVVADLGSPHNDDALVVEDGAVRPDWKSPFLYKVSFGVHTTRFFLEMIKGSGSQDLSAPEYTVSHPDILQVHGREDASVGPFILTEKAPRALTVFYRCLKFSDQEVEVKVKYALGSRPPVEFGWLKSCTQGLPIIHPTSLQGVHQGLKVSTTSKNDGDVYAAGMVKDQWSVEQSKYLENKNNTSTNFYLSATSVVPLNSARLTVTPGNILKARLVGPKGPVSSSTTIRIGNRAEVYRVEYKCLSRGTAHIRLSMVFTDVHDSVEFGWAKECPQPQRPPKKTPSRFYLTANMAMVLFSLGVVGTVAIAVWGYKRWERRKREAEEARRRALEAGYY